MVRRNFLRESIELIVKVISTAFVVGTFSLMVILLS